MPSPRPALAPLAVLAAALLSSCHWPATAVRVALDTDLPWGPGAQMQAVGINVWTGPVLAGRPAEGLRQSRCFTLRAGTGGFALPGSFMALPLAGPSHSVTVEAVAYQQPGCSADPGNELLATRAVFSFTDRVTSELDLFLAGQCLTLQCAANQTCTRSGCVDIMRPTLPPVNQDASVDQSSAVPDAATMPDVSVQPDVVSQPDASITPDAVAPLDAVEVPDTLAVPDSRTSVEAGMAAEAAPPDDVPFLRDSPRGGAEPVPDTGTDGGPTTADAAGMVGAEP